MNRKTKIKLASEDTCTGCSTCASVCAHQAISMQRGRMNHLYPVIDANKCIECSRCVSLCPSINKVEQNPIRKAYAAWAIDEKEYKTSVSGGMASVISRFIISQGGVVYGCAMLPNIVVKHIRVDNEDDLNKLKGSKYVQSDISEVFSQIKVDIKNAKQTLFIGTPCQVAAIKRMYKKQPSNLYLIDLICHGVPSLETLKNHIYHVAPSKEQYQNITFRSNEGYCLVVENTLGEMYRRTLKQQVLGEDNYIGMFYRGYAYRESCYTCQYANSKRVGDITIGDFWGLGSEAHADYIKEHPYGCSVVLPCTDKGMELLNTVKADINYYERSISEAVNGNAQLQHPFYTSAKIRLFRMVQRNIECPYIYKIINIDVFACYWMGKIIRKCKKILAL